MQSVVVIVMYVVGVILQKLSSFYGLSGINQNGTFSLIFFYRFLSAWIWGTVIDQPVSCILLQFNVQTSNA